MTAEIIQFPKPRPWSKYTHNAASRACAEELYEAGLELIEAGGRGPDDDPQATNEELAERMTVETYRRMREDRA
jgi:hypothetical protein